MTLSKKLWYLLTPTHRRMAIVLLGLMVIGMLLETLGIGLVVPAMALVTQSDLATQYPFLKPWILLLGSPSHEWLIVIGMLALLGVYAVKMFFLAFLTWVQAKFVFGVQADLSQRLFTGYLRQPYAFHLQRNSAQLIRNVVTETGQFTFGAMIAGMTLVAELLVVMGIATLLLWVEPLGAVLVVSTLGAAGTIFHAATKTHILHWGEARQLHEGLRLQHLQQGLGGAKDVKLLGREEDFLAQYSIHNAGSALMGRRQNVVAALPRLWLELLAVVGLATLVLTMLAQGKPVASFVPALGLFAAAAFRLMPSANRVLGVIQSLRYSLPVTNILYSEITQLGVGAPPVVQGLPLPFAGKLELCNVSYTYPAAYAAAVTHVSLVINRGTSVGFVGGSGAGKSTLIDLILGLLTPSEGQIKIDGINIQSNMRAWQDKIGYVPQSIYLTDDTLRRNVAFGLAVDQIDEAAVRRAISAAQLDEFISTLPDGLDTVVGERGIRLSGGQRQRIGIARALYHNPSVLVLDEATSSLDTATEQGVMQAVHALKGERTLIIVAHRISTVQHCDRLVRLEKGRLVEEGEIMRV